MKKINHIDSIRNPIITERLTGFSRLLRSNAMAAMENVALWHERDISHSSVERIIIPEEVAKQGLRKRVDITLNQGGVNKKASVITPVPGGVGPMTIMMLLINTIKAAKDANK